MLPSSPNREKRAIIYPFTTLEGKKGAERRGELQITRERHASSIILVGICKTSKKNFSNFAPGSQI